MRRFIALSGLTCLRALWVGALLGYATLTLADTPEISFQQTSALVQVKQLSDLQGKVVYLDFWASWCVPCRRSFPWMKTMQSRYADQGLVVIAINLDQSPELAHAFLAETQPNFHIEFQPSGESAEHFAVAGMPSSFLIDKQGKIRVQHQGFFVAKTERYEQQIQALLAE